MEPQVTHPDYPQNAMRPLWRLTRNQLLNPNNEFSGLFEQFVGERAA